MMAEYAWIHQRFDKISWKYPNAKKVQNKMDQMWINQFAWTEIDLSWHEDRRFAGTCEWTAEGC